jgi:Transposase DDE domain
MGSSISTAKMRSVSWNALEKVEPFTQAVKRQLEILKSTQRTKVFPRAALSDDQLDKVILCIWCLCYSGMQWRTVGLLSGVPFETVYSCFSRWERLGLWTNLLMDLFRRWRTACGDHPDPSVVIMDSRSCRSSPTCGKRGIDGGKKVKGIKMNIIVDKHGFPLSIVIATANTHDTTGILPGLKAISARGFRGKALGDLSYRGGTLQAQGLDLGITIETKAGGAKGTFVPTGLRWVVERSFAWLSRYRRLNTIFERTDTSLIAFVRIAFISILACRLHRLQTAENHA